MAGDSTAQGPGAAGKARGKGSGKAKNPPVVGKIPMDRGAFCKG